MADQPCLKLYLFTHKTTGVTFLAATTQEKTPWVSLHGRLARRAHPFSRKRTRKLQEIIDKYALYPPRECGKTRMRVLRDQWEASVVEGPTTLEEIEAFIAIAISNDTDYTLLNASKTVRCSQPPHPNKGV